MSREFTNKQKLFFVSGKGGVGKSLTSAALALDMARSGKKVLLVELGDARFFSRSFQLEDRGAEPTPWKGGVDVAAWEGEACLREYILHYVKVAAIADLFFENSVMKSLVRAAPALNELAIIGKATSGVRNFAAPMPYDAIVVDSYATGHFLALLKAARGMYEAVKFGPMGRHSSDIDQVLCDPEHTKYVIVTLPEELPVSETLELQKSLNDDFKATPTVFVNKCQFLGATESLPSSAEVPEAAKGFVAEMDRIKNVETEARQRLQKEAAASVDGPFVFSVDPAEVAEGLHPATRGLWTTS